MIFPYRFRYLCCGHPESHQLYFGKLEKIIEEIKRIIRHLKYIQQYKPCEMKDLLCNLSDWFYEKSKNNLVLLLLLAVFLSFNALIFPYFYKLYGLQDHVLLDLQFGYTPEFAHAVLAGYGDYGRQRIMVFTGIVDNVYPLICGIGAGILVKAGF
jgi:hypothetical protein